MPINIIQINFKKILFIFVVGTGKRNGTYISKTDTVDLDKDNFRTSMFIMAFLAFPIVIVALIAFCVRLKNLGKLNKTQLGAVGKNLDNKQKKFGRWLGKATSNKKRNGFTRLNQDSDNDETEHLNRPSNSNDSGSESESDEIGIKLPTLSRA